MHMEVCEALSEKTTCEQSSEQAGRQASRQRKQRGRRAGGRRNLFSAMERRHDLDALKDWGQEVKGWQRMRWLDGIINSIVMSLNKLWEIVKAWHVAVQRAPKSRTWLSDGITTGYYGRKAEFNGRVTGYEAGEICRGWLMIDK